jgi:hypothetical protein
MFAASGKSPGTAGTSISKIFSPAGDFQSKGLRRTPQYQGCLKLLAVYSRSALSTKVRNSARAKLKIRNGFNQVRTCLRCGQIQTFFKRSAGQSHAIDADVRNLLPPIFLRAATSKWKKAAVLLNNLREGKMDRAKPAV